MDAAVLSSMPSDAMSGETGRVINAAEFSELLVSHRRMVRADRRAAKMRGLQDLDTGEVFLTDERRLYDPQREQFGV